MASGNWIVDNLNNALGTWNEKLGEIWSLITQSPETFKGGDIWDVIVNIHGAVKAIGLGLLVLFFVVGVMKTLGSFAEMKRPEVAIKVFIRFVLAKAAVTYGLELMMALFRMRRRGDGFSYIANKKLRRLQNCKRLSAYLFAEE